jgi:hypothetical protein
MALRIRFQHTTGASLGYSIERLSDGLFFDNSSSTFNANPTTPISPLPEDSGAFAGRYKTTISPTPFNDGDYAVTIHDLTANLVVGQLSCVMHAGDDATVFPGSSVGTDPWAVNLPGSYPAGTAGAILGQNLDARISSRSTYAGGPVASVSTPVIVGTNNDKSGYALSSAGMDAISIESGINARQALAPILAAAAGVLTGAGTGAIVIRGANAAISRITATTDNAGNRTSVSLSLPA